MGAGAYVACIPCKKVYYCGYGSYVSIAKRRQAFPAKEHEGHETLEFTEDYTSFDAETGHLMADGGPYSDDVVYIENYREFEHVDVSRG